MGYRDLYRKVVYVNKDDPAFVPGASPSISAENLNAHQDGIINALAAADEIAAEVDVCQEDIGVLQDKVVGVAYRQQFTDIVVPMNAWVEDTPYEDYPFKATIDMPDATENMTPEVIFGLVDAASGLFAPVAETIQGGVVIYAIESPEADITIPSVSLWRN